ncbi:hypothetical protein AVEN_231511-1 [Araneus ventricosus]|uniref:Uncharacterized protein n=1 Tax=Araneus ventricosus TaxID=182803 RepID=A0A4Y1ZWP6_ARAVE|nr:hypothetical protein AVEN_231511-1 [Araneus ventricosus]
MDPQPRNLAQLATALESAWLNIPVNTFRNLIDSLPARLAAVRSAKDGASLTESTLLLFDIQDYLYTSLFVMDDFEANSNPSNNLLFPLLAHPTDKGSQ